MEIQQQIPAQSIHSLMKDPKKYRKIMLIIQQTLYDMGYQQSAKMLEKQSGIQYFTDQLIQIKSHLLNNQYEKAIEIIDRQQAKAKRNHFTEQKGRTEQIDGQNQQIAVQTTQQQPIMSVSSAVAQAKAMIYENYCMSKIINREYEQAMTIISNNIHEQSKRESLCQALVLGNHNLTHADIQKKKQDIFKFCLAEFQQIGQREIQKVIESYTQHQGENNKQLKKLLSTGKRLPPMNLMTSQCLEYIKHQVTHLKFNPNANQLVLIDEGKDFQQILLFGFSQKNWLYQKQLSKSGQLSLKIKYPIFEPVFNRQIHFDYKGKRQSIESLAFNSSNNNSMLAVGSYSLIQLFNGKMDLITQIQAQHKIEKFICMQFHPVSELLYTCGYFDTMQILDSTGQHIASINPYPKMRKFIFNKSEIIGISLVSNKVYKHATDQQILIRQKELDENAIPMDLCLNEKRDNMVVSSLQFIYLIDVDTLQIMGKTLAPLNPGKLMVEVNFYGDFLITLAKTFTCYEFIIDKTIQSPKSFLINKVKEWAGDGTFDINDQLMISGFKTVLIWQEPNSDSLNDEESQIQEDFGLDENRDMEGEEQDDAIDNSDLEMAQVDDSDDDSMDEEDEDISI